MYSMSSGRERAICCLIVVVKNKKERPTGHSSVGAGLSGQLCLSGLFHRFIRFVFLTDDFINMRVFAAISFAQRAAVHLSRPIFEGEL